VAVVFGERSELRVHSRGEPLQRRRGDPLSWGGASAHRRGQLSARCFRSRTSALGMP